MGEHRRSERARTNGGRHLVGSSLEKSWSTERRFDPFALGFDVESEVFTGVGGAGVRIQFRVVDSTLQRLRFEEDAAGKPPWFHAEWFDRFRHFGEANEKRRASIDCCNPVAVDRHRVDRLAGTKESGNHRVAEPCGDECPNLVARKRREIVRVIQGIESAASLVIKVAVVGGDRPPVDTAPRAPLAIEIHFRELVARHIILAPAGPLRVPSGR